MEKLVLERLMDEIARPGRLAEQRAERLADKLTEITAERDDLKERLETARKAELPFSDLFGAADNLLKAKTPTARKAARSRLSSAMCVAEKHIDWIPF